MTKRGGLTVEVWEVELDMFSEAPGAVWRQKRTQTGEAAGSGHGHVSRVMRDKLRSLRLTDMMMEAELNTFLQLSVCHKMSAQAISDDI